jgi:LuxR family transcriptional regulator, maltose regulon positive regulatory protein
VGAGPPASRSSADDSGTRQLAPHVIESRLQPPRPHLELVFRDRLLQHLSAATASLIVVSAPGGSGKTVALSQWAESDHRPLAWLQADEADNDPLVFLHYLTAALGSVADIDPMVSAWLQLAPPPVATRIVPALAAAVRDAAPFVLVVDDAHLVANDACWRVLGMLLDQLPPRAQLCLSSRTSPPLPLARVRASGRLLELGPRELAFSSQETHELLRLHGVARDAETVAQLGRETEGWAAGLYLAALAGARMPAAEWLAGIHGHHRDIARYLASEVLEQQPPDVAEFLLQTSILERLSPNLCCAVTGNEKAGDTLRAVARDNLFVTALDDADEWFRYHHLFAEFLQAVLLRGDEDGAAALHRRAAAWFEAHDAPEEAVRHWLAGGDAGRAGAIVCRAHMDFMRCACYETTRRWLEMFTDEQILADKALTLAAGWIGPMAGGCPRGRRWTAAAMRANVGDETWPDAPVPLRAMQAGLVAALAPEGVTQMRENAEVAVSLSRGAPASERAAVVTQLGVAHWLGGDSVAALRLLREGEEEGAVGNILAQVSAAGYQALILADEGRWDEARTRAAVGLDRVEEAGLSWGVPTYPALLAHVRLRAHDDDSAMVEQIAEIGQILEQGNAATFMALLGEVIVGEILVEQGDLAEATRWMRAGFAHLASMPDAGILRPRLLRLRDRLERRQLLEPLSPAERRVLDLLPTELTLKKIASRLYVSLETVRTHVRDIYRKLDAHSRGEAVERAREIGLLGLLWLLAAS